MIVRMLTNSKVPGVKQMRQGWFKALPTTLTALIDDENED